MLSLSIGEILLNEVEIAVIRILKDFNDDEFHIIKHSDLKGPLINDFNYAVERLEDMSYVETLGAEIQSFYPEAETPQSSLQWEFNIRLIDRSIFGELENP